MSIMTTNIVELTGQRIDLTNWLGWASWWEAALDMGSGITTIYIQPIKATTKERTERGPIFRLSFPSVVDTGEKLLETIANGRNAPKNKPASILSVGEFVLRLQNSQYQHLVGSLADLEGEHPTDAKGDPDRYWGEHIKIVACTAIGAIIPDVHAEVRLNFCMPFTLHSQARKERAIANLDGLYYCYLNEVYHEIDLRVGTVVPEGFAAITRYGNPGGNNVSIDVGDRTTEIIFASGFKLVSRDSEGRTYGVRQVIENIIAALNREGAEIGSNLDTATIYGGGGYIFYGPLKDGIPGDSELENGVLHDLYLPAEAEYLNAAYMQELVGQQTILKPTMWERRR